jgi:hypothetical protein
VDPGRPDRLDWTVGVDAVTAEVTEGFDAAGVPSILLKGPTLARWLYDDGSRGYTDSDLLVDPDRIEAARQELRRLGFEPAFGALPHPGMEAPLGVAWRRGPFLVDLHETLPGAEAPPARVWQALSAATTAMEVGGRSVRVLNEHARLAHVALHAAHHGPLVAPPIADLAAALARLDTDSWQAAARVAAAVDAEAAFANGLCLLPGGRALCDALGLHARPSTAWLLQAAGGVPVADGLERLRQTPGAGAKASILLHEAFPSPEFMRWWTPLARRSGRGLAAAYAWRLLYLAGNTPRGVVAWKRARRRASAS